MIIFQLYRKVLKISPVILKNKRNAFVLGRRTELTKAGDFITNIGEKAKETSNENFQNSRDNFFIFGSHF